MVVDQQRPALQGAEGTGCCAGYTGCPPRGTRALAESQLNLIMGKREIKREAENVRKHLATVFAAETRSEEVDEIPG